MMSVKVEFEYDKKFIFFIPSFNLNLRSKTVEISWLMFNIYFDYFKPINRNHHPDKNILEQFEIKQ